MTGRANEQASPRFVMPILTDRSNLLSTIDRIIMRAAWLKRRW
jgi:hypothetical protein